MATPALHRSAVWWIVTLFTFVVLSAYWKLTTELILRGHLPWWIPWTTLGLASFLWHRVHNSPPSAALISFFLVGQGAADVVLATHPLFLELTASASLEAPGGMLVAHMDNCGAAEYPFNHKMALFGAVRLLSAYHHDDFKSNLFGLISFVLSLMGRAVNGSLQVAIVLYAPQCGIYVWHLCHLRGKTHQTLALG